MSLQICEAHLKSDNLQYGFKRNSNCIQAIFAMRTVVKHYVKNGSTVTLCALDISKAFDRVDHYMHYCNLLWIDICQVILLLYFIMVICALGSSTHMRLLYMYRQYQTGWNTSTCLVCSLYRCFYLMVESSKCWM